MQYSPNHTTHKMKLPRTWLCLLFLSLLVACGPSTKSKGDSQLTTNQEKRKKESATTGEITIGVDETLRPVGRQMVNAFENLYPDSKFNVLYRPEFALYQAFMEDSVRLILSGRDLTEAEKFKVVQQTVTPRTTVLGDDALAVVLHPDNPHDSLTRVELQNILLGSLSNWDSLGEGQSGEMVLVFDQPKTGAIRFLKETLLSSKDTIQARRYAAKGHDDLVEYVSQNPQAIGFIGVSWISDRDQPSVKEYLSKVKLARLETPDTSDMPGVFIRPYQADIALRRYPLTRTFYCHSREHFSGLGTGFAIFAAGERGQRILLKAGLNPQFPPPRFVVFPKKDKK